MSSLAAPYSSSTTQAESSTKSSNITPLSKYKVVFLGDQGTGKTSIIKFFINNSFDASYQSTIGIDFLSKTISLEDRTVRLQIWDSAGQERFRSLIPSYIRDSSVAVVVYDVTNRVTFSNVSQWIEDVRTERGSDVLIMLVGNKTDMTEKRVVSTEEGELLARQLEVMFMETSAKAGSNIKALFRKLATALPSSTSQPTHDESNLIDIKVQTKNSLGSTPPIQSPNNGSCLGSSGCIIM